MGAKPVYRVSTVFNMSDTSHASDSAPTVTVDIHLSEGGITVQGRVDVSTGPTRLSDLLPLVRGLANGVVQETIRTLGDAGQSISCGPGCGACCRMLVPVAEVEARRLREVVEAMSEPRRSQVRARFAAAIRQLTDAGLSSKLRKTDQLTDESYRELIESYFRQQIACPFLENESCSMARPAAVSCSVTTLAWEVAVGVVTKSPSGLKRIVRCTRRCAHGHSA
jgi:hypothetical protein